MDGKWPANDDDDVCCRMEGYVLILFVLHRYLTGHQLAGESSLEGYVSALKRGCRLLECKYFTTGMVFG